MVETNRRKKVFVTRPFETKFIPRHLVILFSASTAVARQAQSNYNSPPPEGLRPPSGSSEVREREQTCI